MPRRKKPKTWTVDVNAVKTVHETFEVEAETEEQAVEKAEAEFKEQNGSDWDTYDSYAERI